MPQAEDWRVACVRAQKPVAPFDLGGSVRVSQSRR